MPGQGAARRPISSWPAYKGFQVLTQSLISLKYECHDMRHATRMRPHKTSTTGSSGSRRRRSTVSSSPTSMSRAGWATGQVLPDELLSIADLPEVLGPR